MLNFLLISDSKYYHTVKESIIRIIRFYPESIIYLYDWGFENDQLEYIQSNYSCVVIVDWKQKLKKIKSGAHFYFPEERDEKQIADLVLDFKCPNIFKKTWRRCKFFTMKSARMREEVFYLWTLENIYLEKIQCQIDMSSRIGDQRFVFIDADAMIVDRLDEIDRYVFDFGFTLRRPAEINFKKNRCTVINVGVVFFGDNQKKRDIFLTHWWNHVLKTDEWIREQTSLTRFLATFNNFKFESGFEGAIQLDCCEISIKLLPCELYNFNWIEEVLKDRNKLKEIKILHFKGARHNQTTFSYLLEQLGV